MSAGGTRPLPEQQGRCARGGKKGDVSFYALSDPAPPSGSSSCFQGALTSFPRSSPLFTTSRVSHNLLPLCPHPNCHSLNHFALVTLLPKMHSLNLIMRRYHINPNLENSTVTGVYLKTNKSQHCEAQRRLGNF